MKQAIDPAVSLEKLAYPLLRPRMLNGFEVNAQLFGGTIKTGDMVKLVTERGEISFKCIGMKHGMEKRLVFVEDKVCRKSRTT